MIRHILRVYKLSHGTSRPESRKALVEFYDSNILVSADIPEYPAGTVVDVSASGMITLKGSPDGTQESLDLLMEKERFYNLSKDILCYRDFELLFRAFSAKELCAESLCELFKKSPFSIFDGAVFPVDTVSSLSITPTELCRFVYPTTFEARKQEIYAFIDYVLQEAEKNGHTGLPLKDIQDKVREMLESQPLSKAERNLTSFLSAKDIWGNPTKFCVEELPDGSDSMVYRKSTFSIERFVYDAVKERLYRNNNLRCEITEFKNPHLSEEQKRAVRFVFNSPGNICIIEGGPGTGKTTIIDEIVHQGRMALSSTALLRIATPTGRAAKRALSALSDEAKAYTSVSTLHKFIGYGQTQNGEMRMDLEAVIEDTYLIIIDEASMMDLKIFEQILILANPYAKIVLVGDADQLPSVDMGDILHDLTMLNVPCVSLHENYRSGNLVVEVASKINEGVSNLDIEKVTCRDLSQSPGVYLVDTLGMDGEAIVSAVSKVAMQDIYRDASSRSGIIITPRRVGVVSSSYINEKIEDYVRLSYEERGIEPPMVFSYMVGEPVIVNETNYHSDTPYMNGETGILLAESSSEDGSVIYLVDIDGNEVFVEGEKALSLSYAITIHKSQGSEYPTVYIVAKDADKFFTRRMLYTAVTRAKDRVCIFADEEMLRKIIENQSVERHTYMKTAKPFFEKRYVCDGESQEEKLCG